jgi:hypothetical protein
VLGLLAALVGGAAFLSYTPWDWLFGGGLLMSILGLMLGVPTGFSYHLRLYRSLRPRGALPPRWWISPHKLHPQLSDEEKRHVMRPFYYGAAGFVVSVVGCVLIAYGAWRSPPG